MKDNNLVSRFFNVEDKQLDTVVFTLPSHWWSRFYEYAWAAEFCKKTDVVLDAACGIPHPLKFYLADNCKEVHAVDSDERIIDIEAISKEIQTVFGVDNAKLDNIDYHHASLTELPYEKGMFDKIFCISAIEHLPNEDEILKALKEFNKVLKDDGMLLLTLDYSTSDQYPDSTDMDAFEKLAVKAGFKLAGEKDSAIPENAVNWDGILYCYRVALVKNISPKKK